MADATLLPTASPKELGKQLRAVRRRKGLSLSEVARGAGLSRRELVSYERGKVEIPESDLWVIAGSCGVDVAELVPPRDPAALTAGPETIEDSISQLRRNHHGDGGLQRHLDTLHALRALPPGSVVQLQDREREAMAEALGGDAASIEEHLVATMRVSRDEARRLRSLIIPDTGYSPLALSAPPASQEEPTPRPTAAAHANLEAAFVPSAPDPPTGPVDVFEELAKLPEPVALPEQHASDDDIFSRPRVTVHAADAGTDAGAGAFTSWSSIRSALPEPSTPVVVEPVGSPVADSGPSYGAAHAPPIDVVGRLDVPGASHVPAFDTPEVMEPGGWQPPAPTMKWDAWLGPRSVESDAPPTDVIEFVDELTPGDFPNAHLADDGPADGPIAASTERADATDESPSIASDSAWTSWATTSYLEEDPPSLASRFAEVPFATLDGSMIEDGSLAGSGTPRSATPWGHQPDPEASSTGFYVDWGGTDAVADDSPAATATPVADDPPAPVEAQAAAETPVRRGFVADIAFDAHDERAPRTSRRDVDDDDLQGMPPDDPAPISWRPLAENVLAAVAAELAATGAAEVPAATEPVPVRVEEFVVAGTKWDLGNALPLVEVRGHGGLVMRRADERWALADVAARPRFVLEVDVDFRSGPGFGVLFCASTDADGRMSGYSFDIDPIHEGGSYLVRQWSADRELWNPLAHVPASDPADMHGALTVRIVVIDDAVTASVNGNVVVSVDNLQQACAHRYREPAIGDRVGIQAWSSSDLVIDELRVAEH